MAATASARTMVLVAVAAAVFLAGCGDSGPVVNVYSARSHYGTEAVFNRFTEETGVKVEILGGDPAGLVDRIASEGERTPADLLITTDAGYLWRAADLGLLASLDDAQLERVVAPGLRDAEGRWFAISQRARTVMRSTERVPASDAPTTYAALGDPAWRGRLCLRTSNNSYNQSLVASLIADRGEPATRRLLEGWMANEPTIFGNDVEVLEAIAAGRCDIGLTNTYYLGNKLRDDPGFPVAPVWVEQDGAGTHVNVSGVGLTANAEHRDDAIALMRYLLTPEAQELIAEGNSEYPVREGVPAAEWIRDWGTFEADEAAVQEIGPNQPAAVRLMNDVGWE